MSALRVCVAPACAPEAFLGWGAGLLARAEAPTVVLAPLAGRAIALGRFQRRTGALAVDALEGASVVRRNSGGRAIRVGDGALGALFAVPDLGELFGAPVPPAKGINRLVRGLLSGLTRAGVPAGARYFGRDFVAGQGQQLAVVGQDGGPRAALFEAVVAVDGALELPAAMNGYPTHGDPRAGGPAHTTLAALRGAPIDVEALADAIAAGFAEVHGTAAERVDVEVLPTDALAPPVVENEAGWSDSGVADVPIGFVEALVRHDDARLLEVRLRGDFMAPGFVIDGLEQALEGCPLDRAALGARIDAAFHQPGAYLIGMRELGLFADAVLTAAGRL